MGHQIWGGLVQGAPFSFGPLLLAGLALLLLLDRWLRLRRERLTAPPLLATVRSHLEQADLDGAIAAIEETQGTVANVLDRVLHEAVQRPKAVMRVTDRVLLSERGDDLRIVFRGLAFASLAVGGLGWIGSLIGPSLPPTADRTMRQAWMFGLTADSLSAPLLAVAVSALCIAFGALVHHWYKHHRAALDTNARIIARLAMEQREHLRLDGRRPVLDARSYRDPS